MYVYLDDGLGVCETLEEAIWASGVVRADLNSSGFKDQTVKSFWDLVKLLKWLGFLIDLLQRKLSVPQGKVDKILEALRACQGDSHTSPRKLQRIAGLINSLALVLSSRAYI